MLKPEWRKYLPFLEWLPGYSRGMFRNDLVAGLTVGVMLVPQGMAYAMLAGMPPIYGLYGGLLPLILYGLLGTSRQLSIGPVAISAILVLAGISQLAEPLSPEFASLVILTGFMIGIFQVAMGFLRLGFLVNFLSHPVIRGFTSAAAVIIAISQLKYLLGFPIPRFERSYETFGYAITHIDQIHWQSFAICLGGILVVVLLKLIRRAIPGALIITVLGVVAVASFGLHEKGVEIVGNVPKGLPGFRLPEMSLTNILSVLPTVLTVAIIGIVESIGIAKVMEAKNKDTRVRPTQELIALGVSKIGGALFQSLPTSGSFTRSAVYHDTGAKTGMASIITAGVIGLTLLFFTPFFYYLPEAILAAIVLVAVKSLFDVQGAIRLWHIHKQDFMMMMTTFILTLLMGIEMGVLIGVILSLAMIIYRAYKTHVAVLGRLPDTTYYRNVERFENAIQEKGMLILRFDAQLFFGNVEFFKDTIFDLINGKADEIEVFVLDASCIEGVDSGGLEALEDVISYLNARKIRFQISGVIGPVRDLFHKTGLMERIGKENNFMYLQDAEVAYRKMKAGGEPIWSPEAIQTNLEDET